MKKFLAISFVLGAGLLLGGAVAYAQPQSPVEFQYATTVTRPNDAPTKPPMVVTPVKKPAPPKIQTITLSPVTALYSQKTIDQGKLVTWMTSPTCLLAGHDTRGWAWLDNIATGTIIVVKTGPCAGKYRVVGHEWQSRKGGPIPAWMSKYALVLQTCTGKSGMGFSTAQRI